MNKNILLGVFVLLGLAGAVFAWGGLFGQSSADQIPDDVKEQFKVAFEQKDFETLNQLREQYRPEDMPEPSADVLELRNQINDAMQAGDYGLAKELRDQMKDLRPEGAPGFGPHNGMHGGSRGMFKGEGCPCMQNKSSE